MGERFLTKAEIIAKYPSKLETFPPGKRDRVGVLAMVRRNEEGKIVEVHDIRPAPVEKVAGTE